MQLTHNAEGQGRRCNMHNDNRRMQQAELTKQASGEPTAPTENSLRCCVEFHVNKPWGARVKVRRNSTLRPMRWGSMCVFGGGEWWGPKTKTLFCSKGEGECEPFLNLHKAYIVLMEVYVTAMILSVSESQTNQTAAPQTLALMLSGKVLWALSGNLIGISV